MADITVTKANVRPLPNAVCRNFMASAAGHLGDPVYVDANGEVAPADGSAAGTAYTVGIVVAVANEGKVDFADGDPVSVCLWGPVVGYSGMTPGGRVFQSDTAGALADAAGTVVTLVGLSLTAEIVLVAPQLPIV